MNTTSAKGKSGAVKNERVEYSMNPDKPGTYIPRISVTTTKASGGVEKSFRPFEAADMERVLDYENVEEPPADMLLRVGEDHGAGRWTFPKRFCCLRGTMIFYFDKEDVDDKSGPYVTYHNPPLGVVLLDHVETEKPGGRRVFREHNETEAKDGYEFRIDHFPPDVPDTPGISDPIDEEKEFGDESEEEVPAAPISRRRKPVFLVTNSSGERERWAEAIMSRCENHGPITLRTSSSTLRTYKPGAATQNAKDAAKSDLKVSTHKGKDRKGGTFSHGDTDVAAAVNEFGFHGFSEHKWLDNFFENHDDLSAPARCDQMEHWQASIKKQLKQAVLEQYEYFVQASGEMTSMEREVTSLKNLVETQMETIREMKEIDFSKALHQFSSEEMDMAQSDDEDDSRHSGGLKNKRRLPGLHFGDDNSEVSSVGEGSTREDRIWKKYNSQSNLDYSGSEAHEEHNQDPAHMMEIPGWLMDVNEEISAFVKESRYSDAVELWVKARNELADLVDKHERPIEAWLSKQQQADLTEVNAKLVKLAEQMGNRLGESLRRKNEALKQASKRERSDPRGSLAPVVSPCCLDDDAIPLQLLVKLGKTHEAAMAFSSRRSLLLLESLHEHPISGAGNVDLVIYSAQLSQSFFSCLSSSVEGFLDLFLVAAPPATGDKEESSISSSLHSHSSSKNIPAGAVASVVLWCDAELAKFASAFGGARILANLALSPPPRNAPRQPRVVDGHADTNGNKERQNAIEVAAQCVEQAFMCASQNLDSVGLPLTPRLAEFIRSRLKGCEAEVAALLEDRWSHVTLDWQPLNQNNNGMGL